MTIELALLSRVSYRDQEITSPRLRGLLALLASDLRSGASTARLVDGLWPDEQPDNPTKALQVLVSRARALVGGDVIASTPTGYRLDLREDQVDAAAVSLSASVSAQHSRAGDHEAALAHAETGLALWDGRSDGDSALADPLSALRAERRSTHRSLVRAQALALSRLGRRAEALEGLTDLARERPRDEEVLLELLRCEAATEGPATALARYDAYRRALRDELGADPGAALQAEHQQLLEGELPPVRHGIPHEPNPLLGRDADIAAVTGLLRTSRVTSIVGPGGLGKTRLAYVVSREAEQRVVHLVPLAGVTADEDVAGEVASALGVGEPRRSAVVRTTDLVATIVTVLGPAPALLVLDNCEHVLNGAADLVHALVSMTRDLRVLTTSRAPLGLSSEVVYQLPELDLPTTVELFERRARAARPRVDLPADVVAELCRHLDGLPLAAELAAARVRVMSVAEIAKRLEDRFALLRGGARDAPSRHRTLHAVVDWSWNLLEPAGQVALRALSVFAGGFTAAAAARVLDDGDVLETLEHLVDQSLLKAVDTPQGIRFRMLETVREFSAAHREEAVTDRFLGWAREFGIANYDTVFGAGFAEAAALIRIEQDNLLQALRLALARDDGATVAATGAVLAGLWIVESTYGRMGTLVAETSWLLSHYQPEPATLEVTRSIATLGTLYTLVVPGPRTLRPLAILRRLPPAEPTNLMRAMAIVLADARETLGEDYSALRALGDSDEPLLAGVANGMASYLLERDNDIDGALKAAVRMLDVFDSVDYTWMRVLAHSRIGEVCLQTEQAVEAERHLRMALAVQGEGASRRDVIGIRWGLVLANLQLGNLDDAEQWLDQVVLDEVDEAASTVTFGRAARAAILLARGEIDAGLRAWRWIVDQLRHAEEVTTGFERGMDPWYLETRSVCVVAHAQHGRLDLVADVVSELPDAVRALLAYRPDRPPAFFMRHTLCGLVLVAIAMVDIERGTRTGDSRAKESGARLVALAERFRYPRTIQPTMSQATIRAAAATAAHNTYTTAATKYANLNEATLRATALSALSERPNT